MKTNHCLFIRRIFQLVSLVAIFFLLQGCFCKQCATGLSKEKAGAGTIPRYALNDQDTYESGSSALPSAEDAPHSTLNPAQQPVQTELSMEDEIISVQPTAVHYNVYNVNTIILDQRPVTPSRIINQENRYTAIEEVIAAKLADGKSCPLGIRSISSEIIAGPNMSFKSSKEGSDAYGTDDHKHKAGAGFQLGIGYTLGFTDKFSVSPALLLKQNNASEKIKYNYTEPGSTGGGENTDKYSYTSLSVPVVANYQVGKQVQVFAGPEFNYLLRASVKSKGDNGSDNKENITKNSVNVGVGVQAGVKYKIPSGNGDSPFAVQLLYEHRISRLNKKNPEGYGNYNTPAWNMKGFQLGVTCSICELMKGRN